MVAARTGIANSQAALGQLARSVGAEERSASFARAVERA